MDSPALKQRLKQECSHDLFYNAQGSGVVPWLCLSCAVTQGHLFTLLLWSDGEKRKQMKEKWGEKKKSGEKKM